MDDLSPRTLFANYSRSILDFIVNSSNSIFAFGFEPLLISGSYTLPDCYGSTDLLLTRLGESSGL